MVPLDGYITGLVQERRSLAAADLPELTATGSRALCRRLAATAYSSRHLLGRPMPSAGGLVPLQLFSLTTSVESDRWQLEAGIINRPGELLAVAELSVGDVNQLFAPDPFVGAAIDAGVGIILLAADPNRTTSKYGDRGWQYILLEAGEVVQQATLLVLEHGGRSRPIGGYLDEHVDRFLQPFLSIATLLVGAPCS